MARVMNPTVVSNTIQEFGGHRYYRCGRYFSRALPKGGREYLHRAVWAAHFGEIPDDVHIHHDDDDRAHNAIDNLTAMLDTEHLSLHWTPRGSIEFARLFADLWHGSEEGRRWHREHWRNHSSHLVEKTVIAECEQCGGRFQKMPLHQTFAKYCSNACKSAARRASGVDDVERVCPQCGQTFQCNKYAKQVTCSKTCAAARRFGR